MINYLFYSSADKAQDEIWQYTCEEWSEKQAEKYIKGLHDHLQALSEKNIIWRRMPDSLIVPPDLDLQVFFTIYEHHYIFFREFASGKIGIMSILHEKSDMPVHLYSDLLKITDKTEA